MKKSVIQSIACCASLAIIASAMSLGVGASAEINPLDVNQDGKISVLDIIALKNHILEAEDMEVYSYDTNSDGKVSSLDLIALKSSLIGDYIPEETTTLDESDTSQKLTEEETTTTASTPYSEHYMFPSVSIDISNGTQSVKPYEIAIGLSDGVIDADGEPVFTSRDCYIGNHINEIPEISYTDDMTMESEIDENASLSLNAVYALDYQKVGEVASIDEMSKLADGTYIAELLYTFYDGDCRTASYYYFIVTVGEPSVTTTTESTTTVIDGTTVTSLPQTTEPVVSTSYQLFSYPAVDINVSNGNDSIKPFEILICSNDGFACADGLPMFTTSKEKYISAYINDIPEIAYTEDMKMDFEVDPAASIGMNCVLTSDYQVLSDINSLEDMANLDDGIYIVELKYGYSDENKSTSSYYCFKVIIGKPCTTTIPEATTASEYTTTVAD